MTIEAPLSKSKKNNLKIYIFVCILIGVWFGYDGYFSEKFIQKHTNNDKPDSTLVFNRKSPPFFIAAGVLLGVYLLAIKNKKLVADENEFVIGSKEKIPYSAIQKINKTNFDSKGFFLITYKNNNGSEINRKISDRTYDNLAAVLDKLVAKIS
ncbi:MAG: hypothetical protein PHY02_08730 [Phycisphaerae bacterium]|nr:hypothetical protein [Phycisphaerae bacterium]